jgi:hypothetical protein
MMDDPYYAVVLEHWSHVLQVYQQFEKHNPIILIDVQEVRIYAYPYEEFKADLSGPSQLILAEQYADACLAQKIVVFVRDNDKEKLVSYAVGGGDLSLAGAA